MPEEEEPDLPPPPSPNNQRPRPSPKQTTLDKFGFPIPVFRKRPVRLRRFRQTLLTESLSKKSSD